MSDIKKTMKALVVYGLEDFRLETEYPVPQPSEGEILIRVEACGICAGDVKAFHGSPRVWGGNGNPKYIKEPMILGHEFVGYIVELGKNVKGGFEIGDRVVAEQIVPCWECRFCNTGKYWMCHKHDIFGFRNNVNGGMAEYMIFPKGSMVHKVPKELPLEKAVLIEPFACSKHAVDRAKITNEDTVVLSGAGTLGLGMLGAIKLKNPKTVIVLDLSDKRLELAKKFGADVIVNPSIEDPVEKVLDMTGGYGCDVYIEATGYPDSVSQGLAMITKLGRFIEFGVFAKMTTVDWSVIGDVKEIDILGAHLGPYCYEPVIEWLNSGKLKTDGVVSHKYPLEKWSEAFAMAANSKESLKVVLIP